MTLALTVWIVRARPEAPIVIVGRMKFFGPFMPNTGSNRSVTQKTMARKIARQKGGILERTRLITEIRWSCHLPCFPAAYVPRGMPTRTISRKARNVRNSVKRSGEHFQREIAVMEAAGKVQLRDHIVDIAQIPRKDIGRDMEQGKQMIEQITVTGYGQIAKT